MPSKRIRNRKELRADYDAAERQKTEGEESEETEEEDEDEDEDEGEEAEGDGEADAEEDGEEDDDDEDAPKKKKKKKAVAKPAKAAKPKAKPRTRTAKVVRMKVVWGVFNNSNQRVAVYEYPKRKEADEHAARLTADKKSTHFVQPIKEPLEEKEK